MSNLQDYFALFGMAKSPFVDSAQLRKNYLVLQQQFHPDKLNNHTEQEKLLAVHMTAQINEAYRVLNDDILRAEYLLSQVLNTPLDDSQTIQDDEFLLMQMELHEEIESMETDIQKELFIKKIKRLLDMKYEMFANSYPHDIAIASATLKQMQFFNRLNRQALQRIV